MIDQIVISDKASFDDFGASVAKRKIGQPPKKTIKESVPFSNVTYDFTKINGEIYWEERELEYVLEMTAATPEQLEEMKTALSSWLMNIIQEELHDPIIPDYHFIVTYEDMSFEDEDGMEKTTATVVFSAYPYKIANCPKVYEAVVPYNEQKAIAILNESSHKVTAKIEVIGEDKDLSPHNMIMVSRSDGTVFAECPLMTGTYYIGLSVGLNAVVMFYIASSGEGDETKVTVTFTEEVF
jgi:hypothetical protein